MERFLETASRWLRVPWWLVHAGLYVLTGLLAARCVNLQKLFPGGPGMALWGVFAAEFAFTTWMLVHLRQARTLALLAVARIESGPDRLTWLRRFYSPMHWGWIIRARNASNRPRQPESVRENPESANNSQREEAQTSQFSRASTAKSQSLLTLAATLQAGSQRLGLLPLTLLLMAGFYVYLLWPSFEPGSPGPRLIFSFHLLGLYPLAAKAAMLLAVLAHFWLLRGLVQVARGAWSSSLTEHACGRFWIETRRWALRLNFIVALATGAWMYIHAVSVGPTIWPYALSVGLMALFLTQGIILGDLRLQPITLALVLAQIAHPLISALRGLHPLYNRTETWAALVSLACPIAGGCAGALVRQLASH